MRKRKTAGIVVVFSFALALAGCGMPAQPEQEAAEKATPVQVTKVEQGNLSRTSEIIGTAVPSKETDIFPKMNGELIVFAAEENQYVEKGATIGRIDSENLSIQLELEQLALEHAETQYKDLLRSNAPQSQLENAENSLKQIQLRIRLAQNNLENSVITAPISGTITAVNVHVGDLVSSAAPVARVVQLNPIRIKASLSTSQMLALQGESQIPTHFPDVGLEGQARIVSLSTVADNAGFYTLEAEMDNAEGTIKSGMMAKFLMEIPLVQDALLVPTSAIVEKGGVPYVFVVRDGRAVETALEVIESQSDVSAVLGDLAAGENVVVKGQYTLSDGGLVNLVEEEQ